MFVQALAAYADKNLQAELNDVAFEERAVPYYLQISADGSFLGVTPRFEQVAPANGKGKPKQRQLTHRVPRSPVERNSGEHPLLGADDIGYVLGRIDIYTLQAEWFLLKWEYVAKPL
jgi:CRISPR-associated protein Csd1